MNDLKNIIESLIFVSDGPLTIDRIKGVLPETDPTQIRMTLDTLIEEYEALPRGFYLREIAGGFQFRTRPEYKTHIAELLRSSPPRLSRAALETLAIIAYKQPIIRADIEHIRGVDSGGVLRMLMERKLVRVLGRREIPGRPLIYATTKTFLEVFDLKNLKELPTPKEIEELSAENETFAGIVPETVTVVRSPKRAPSSEDSAQQEHPERAGISILAPEDNQTDALPSPSARADADPESGG